MGFDQPVEEMHEIRKKRLRYQAWHRGMRELDLILGPYVDRNLTRLTGGDMDALEALFAVPDNELYRWICGQQPTPPEHDTPLMRNIISATRLGAR
jgi:antitoxin CptB